MVPMGAVAWAMVLVYISPSGEAASAAYPPVRLTTRPATTAITKELVQMLMRTSLAEAPLEPSRDTITAITPKHAKVPARSKSTVLDDCPTIER